ncbi:MAG: PHP domain-containing protein, partial [Clostridia bacterium]|nr:PHP domain-containing protein [Clostridia bacterium]
MKQFLFPEKAKFYKANLHCHTDVSDGKLTPAEVKAAYKAKGYHAVAFTDHEALIGHAELCDESFIALHGYETAIKEVNGVSTLKNRMLKVHHLIFLKKKQDDLTQFCFYPENFTPGNCK